MRKGIGLYNPENCPIYFEPNKDNVLPIVPELFVDITDIMVPGVKPYYMISNYARLFHKFRNQFLTVNIDSKGYLYKPLSTIDGPKNCRIHRLVMMGFYYFPGCEDYLVNHKDGNKGNCSWWNLEWSNYSENGKHAYRIGLHGQDVINEEKIRDVCVLLEDSNITLKEVADRTGVSYATVQAIQNKRSHNDISDQYNIKLRKINNNFSIDQVDALCFYYQEHPRNKILDEYCKDALKSIGIINPGYNLIKAAKKIFQKETYTYVSCNYNF